MVEASNQQLAPALDPVMTTPLCQASRRTASSPCRRHTASMLAVFPPPTNTTSWAKTWPRRSAMSRLKRRNTLGSQPSPTITRKNCASYTGSSPDAVPTKQTLGRSTSATPRT